MTTLVVLSAVTAGVGSLWLAIICWKRRPILAGLAGLAGIPLIIFAVTDGLTEGMDVAALVIALIFVIEGATVLRFGQVFERLLGDGPEPAE